MDKSTRVFFVSAESDKGFAASLARSLREREIVVWSDIDTLSFGDGGRLPEPPATAAAILVLLSQSLLSSPELQFALWKTVQRTTADQKIIPVRIDNSMVPSFLGELRSVDMRGRVVSSEAISQLVKLIRSTPKKVPPRRSPDQVALAELRKELRQGNLALFCGAGVSRAAKLPDWDSLMQGLFDQLFDDGDSEGQVPLGRYLDRSPLVLGKFFRNSAGREFRALLRSALYPSSLGSSIHRGIALLDAIAQLCAPPRSGQPLRSVITFNFDDLLEGVLRDRGIRYASIYDEGQRSSPDELPIYHVHGFLPQSLDQISDHDLVFSEDSYHSRFIDPYSWSNLVQLNHLHGCTCLLVGLSLRDPNLRRLLDVSIRKNAKRPQRHYVILKRHRSEESENNELGQILEKRVQFVDEQDANQLGLNVIWVDEYSDIPPLIENIGGPVAQ